MRTPHYLYTPPGQCNLWQRRRQKKNDVRSKRSGTKFLITRRSRASSKNANATRQRSASGIDASERRRRRRRGRIKGETSGPELTTIESTAIADRRKELTQTTLQLPQPPQQTSQPHQMHPLQTRQNVDCRWPNYDDLGAKGL